ncbi:MAG: hypothetical protein GTO40_20615 [Deltaproteobacteria bacterium]|nr:hypothetical protein [Deltaproteobacteria bacterium]
MDFLNYNFIKWIVFTVLSLTVPAVLFLVMAVIFMPAVFFAGGIGYVIPKLLIPKSSGESFWFILIMAVHLTVYGAVYYGVSTLAAKAITRLRGWGPRIIALLTLCSALIFSTTFRIYGGGGHGPIRWKSLWDFWAEINNSYGAWTVQTIYVAAILVLTGYLLAKNRRSIHSRAPNSTTP